MQYELFYLVGESKESQLDQIKEGVKKIVANEGGNLLEPEIIEKRKMSYKIGSDYRGIYVAQRFEVPDSIQSEKDGDVPGINNINSINKKLNLNQDVLRFMIIKADGLPELKPRELPRREERPAYSKKSIPDKKEPAKKKPVDSKESKSIDEKLEEILNI
jgi:ribosomal protein S6